MLFEYIMIALYLVGLVYATVGIFYYMRLKKDGFKWWYLVYIIFYPVFIYSMLSVFPAVFAYLKELDEL